jgi:hypothetical protein
MLQTLGSIIVFMDVIAKHRVGSMLFGGGVAVGVRRPVTGHCSALKCRPANFSIQETPTGMVPTQVVCGPAM